MTRRPSMRGIALAATATTAIVALPRDAFPLPWLFALSLPALLLLGLRRTNRWSTLDALAIAAVAQLTAIIVTNAISGPLDPRAAIGGTLLPPLVYLTIRGETLDAPRSVFLAFCVFVIAAILGNPSALHVMAFVAAAIAALQADVVVESFGPRASWRGERAGIAPRVHSAVTVVMAGLVAFLACFQLFRLLPSHDARPTHDSARRAVAGPSREFELEGRAGELLDLRDDELVRVRSGDGRAIPRDLYLRCGHFDIAELDRWRTRPGQRYLPPGDVWVLREPHPALTERRFELELMTSGSRLAFVPAGATSLTVPDGLVGNRRMESFEFRTDRTNPGVVYIASCQALDHLDVDSLPARGASARLLELSPSILRRRAMFEEILTARELRGRMTPLELAKGIAAVLQARCRYALREPTGPYGHALLNFLDGDRQGFCMHFASATAICLRLVGVPCRIGVGLYGGEPHDEESGARRYGSRHAHAWVEIPFDGLGWVVFDPTPPAVRTRPMWPAPDLGGAFEGTLDGESAGNELDPAKPALATFAALGAEIWVWVLIAALIAVPILLTFRPRGRAGSPTRALDRTGSAARRLLEVVLDRLAQSGHRRHAGEGLLHYAERLHAAGIDEPDVRDAFLAYLEIRFGGRPLDDDRRTRLARAASEPEKTAR